MKLLIVNSTKKEKFFVKSKLLLKEEDVDGFGNAGCWKPTGSFKMIFMASCKKEEILELIKNNPKFEFVIVEN